MKYKTFHDWILDNIPEDSNMLEFGSGIGTKRFVEKFNVTSIEHNSEFLNLHGSYYIHAPIINGWYDTSKLTNLNNFYNVILIDGPTGIIGRSKFLDNLHLFNLKTIIVVDDLNRVKEKIIFDKLLIKLNNPKYEIFKGIDRDFGIIYNE